VNTTADSHDASPGDDVCGDPSGLCSLRAAVEESEAHADYDTIQLAGDHYVLSFGSLTFNVGNVDVFGNGSIIDANQASRVILVNIPSSNDVTLYTLTIENGRGGNLEPGGGVYVYSGTFYGYEISIVNNQTTSVQGGGIAVGGYLRCNDCTIGGNTTSTRTSGGAQYSGGGVFVYDGGEVALTRTTVSGNTAVRGGGIAGGGILTLLNTTVTGNRAIAGGGGLKTMTNLAQWTIAYSTITNNQANSPGTNAEPNLGGGILHTMGSMRIGKTIIAGNSDNRTYGDPNFSPDCATTSTTGASGPYTVNESIESDWDNIIGNIGDLCYRYDVNGGSLGAYDAWGYGQYPLSVPLGPLQNNGGSVLTNAPLPGSIAIDFASSGNPTGDGIWDCGGVDATWTGRPQGYACDSGSVETH